MGCSGASCHPIPGTQASSHRGEEGGMEWFPWKQAAVLLLVSPWYEQVGRYPMCGPASPSHQGSNLIKHPAVALSFRRAGFPRAAARPGSPHAVCSGQAWLCTFGSSDLPPRFLCSLPTWQLHPVVMTLGRSSHGGRPGGSHSDHISSLWSTNEGGGKSPPAWKHPKCVSAGEWMSRAWPIQTLEYYLARRGMRGQSCHGVDEP